MTESRFVDARPLPFRLDEEIITDEKTGRGPRRWAFSNSSSSRIKNIAK